MIILELLTIIINNNNNFRRDLRKSCMEQIIDVLKKTQHHFEKIATRNKFDSRQPSLSSHMNFDSYKGLDMKQGMPGRSMF